MNVFDLVASLSIDTKEYERGLVAAKGMATSSSKDITRSVAGIKKGAMVASGAIVAGMAAFGVSSIKAGMQFDTSMSQVAATMGKTNEELQNEVGEVDLAWGKFSGNLREYAQEMGAHTAFSATEAADALNYMALAGYDTQKSMQMLPNVLNLAAAGSMDLATASDMVTDASSALGLNTEQTTKMVDQMAMASSKSNTSVAQLGEAFLTVGGTAKNLKGGTTELSTALGILADNGMKGSEGGTILRNVITSLTAPTSKAKGELEALGVSVFDSEGNMRSMNDIMGDLSSSMSTLTAEERAEAMSKIFNKRDLKGVEALLAGTGERWEELSGYIDDAQGSAQKMADTQLDNLQGDITLLKSAWEGLQISVSDKLTPALRKLVKALTWAIDHAGTLGPIVLGLATAFVVFSVAINIGSIIRGVTTAMAALNAVMLANPIGLIVALIAGLIVAFIALWKNNETFRNKVIAIWSKVKTIFVTVFTAIKTAASVIWNAIKDNIIKPVTNAYNSAVLIFNKFKSKTSEIWNAIKSTTIRVWSAIRTSVSTVARTIQSAITGAWNKIKSITSSVWKAVRTAITAPITAARSVVNSVVNGIKSVMSFSGISGKVRSAFNAVKSAITSPIQSAKDTLKGIVDKIKGAFPIKISKILSGLPRLPKVSISVGERKVGPITVKYPKLSWNAKAMLNPYMFTGATLFGAGEAGDEMLYGKSALMKDISHAVNEGNYNNSNSIVINLNYNASADANDMVRDIARGVKRYRMAGAF